MVVAQIAYERVTEETRTKLDALQKVIQQHYPAFNTFTILSIWADEVKQPGHLPFLEKCHYTNLPYDPENVLSKREFLAIERSINWRGVVSTVSQAEETLKNGSAPLLEKAIMLSLLIHCVADVHQPLHCTSRFTSEFPHGDMGGTLCQLTGCRWQSLHQLWDSGAGAFPSQRYFDSPFDVTALANHLTSLYPPDTLPELNEPDPIKWAEKSRQLAIDIAYDLDENKPPSEEYCRRVQKTSERQITIAGYRLAKMLEKIL